ncbi:hypothetical protein JEV36_07305 [Pseudomonas aeruginosa]|nr:hypothetical protein [Pseudomonas aeruginosa]
MSGLQPSEATRSPAPKEPPPHSWLAFVKGTNLTNQTVRYASSILRDRVPAAGRGIEAGVKVAF